MAEYTDEEWRSYVDQKRSTVTQYLNQAKVKDAFTEVLDSPPAGCKDQAVRDTNAETFNNVLNAVKEAEIPNFVKELNVDQLDVLMRYIYRLFERGDNSQKLLAWHEHTLAVGGLGSIIRALTDRRPL